VEHDKDTAINGSYKVLLPAGISTLQVRRYPELSFNAFVVQNVTFNANNSNANLTPITIKEATRTGSYNRTVNIDLTPGGISGIVYDDKDGDESYNISSDEVISGVEIQIYGIKSFDPTSGQPTAYDFSMARSITTEEEGYYNATELLPGYYQIVALTKEGYQIDNTVVPVYGGENTYDIIQPKVGSVKGTVYFDNNRNGTYDSGEEMDNVNLDLIYTSTGENKVVSSLMTDTDGSYSFTDFLPGNYQLQMKKLPDYESSLDITITENTTTSLNAFIEYASIKVSGETKNQETIESVANITITFSPSLQVENNTAESATTKSDAASRYSIDLKPGTYNVSVFEERQENNINVTYSYEETLVLDI
jgi:hypothetical protein